MNNQAYTTENPATIISPFQTLELAPLQRILSKKAGKRIAQVAALGNLDTLVEDT